MFIMKSLALLLYTLKVNFFGLEIDIGDMSKSLITIIQWGFNVTPATNGGVGANIWQLGNNLYDIVTTVAGSLLVLFLMLELVSMCTRTGDVSSITWERITLTVAKYFMIYAVYKAAPWVLQSMSDIVQDIFGQVTSSLTTGTVVDLENAISNAYENVGIIEKALMTVMFIMGGAAYLGTAVSAIAGVFQRAVKLVMFYGISPIPIAMMAYHETAQTGKRFIMSYFATLVEGIFILIIIYIYSYGLAQISTPNGMSEALGTVTTISLMNAVLTGGISLAGQVAKDAVG